MRNFRALESLPSDPRAFGGWGLCPQTPSLRRLGASPPDPHWPPAARGSAHRSPKQPPHCKFLATRLWPILKDKVAVELNTSAKDLEMAIKRLWTQQITAEYCKHRMHSMLCCLQAVIKNKGGHTKY